jgi:hypothetical protein
MALFAGVGEQVERLSRQLEQQAAVLEELRARLGKNSRNRGSPPLATAMENRR